MSLLANSRAGADYEFEREVRRLGRVSSGQRKHANNQMKRMWLEVVGEKENQERRVNTLLVERNFCAKICQRSRTSLASTKRLLPARACQEEKQTERRLQIAGL